jgi:alpha-tubulin suppressor-like RCC1 family protein
LQGITLKGEIVFACWGRCDMGQIPASSSGLSSDQTSIPHPMALLAPSICSAPFVEIWCGSEYTIACTALGELWSRGWREHGNLGHDPEDEAINSSHVCLQWVPLKSEFCDGNETNSKRLVFKNIWEGNLACGGAHCLALLDP